MGVDRGLERRPAIAQPRPACTLALAGPDGRYSARGRLAVDGALAKPVRSGRKQP